MTSCRAQRGQTLVIFALVAVAIVGLIALAIDFGFTTNQRRNLQEFADHAALAGVTKLPSDEPGARQLAFEVLRDNLGMALCATATGCLNPQATCAGTAISFASNVDNCHLQSPYDNYTISIASHSSTIANPIITSQGTTLSVTVNEAVGSSLAGVFGQNVVNTGVVSVATIEPAHHFNIGLYTDDLVSFNDQLAIVDGDLYARGQGVLATQAGDGRLCVGQSFAGQGNAIFAPGVAAPSGSTQGQSQAQCQGSLDGTLAVTGSLVQNTTSPILPPSYLSPPNIPSAAGVPNQSCLNGSRNALGATPSNCFQPGVYSTLTNIQNNLNPGIYTITGDGVCSTNCVTFSQDTMNANFSDVADKCWTGAFTLPCPTGFAFNPLDPALVTDPQCQGSAIGALSTPGAPTVAGNLAPAGTMIGTYYVRVTALNAMGESLASAETAVALTALQTSLTVTVSPVAGATSYNFYGPSDLPGKERLTVTGAAGQTSQVFTAVQSSGGVTPPIFDTTSCSKGMRNIPAVSNQNNGVTFVLQNNAGMSFANGAVVLLSPYCSQTCPGGQGGNINDGAFVIYSPQGTGTISLNASNNAEIGWTGSLYMPQGRLSLSRGAFELFPGQAFLRDAVLNTNNGSMPLIYWDNVHGATMPPGARLIQ